VGALSVCTASFLHPALHPAGKNFSTKGIKFPLMNHDALNESLGGNIVTAWNPWKFHKTVEIISLDTTVLFSTSDVFSSRAVYIPRGTYSW
jgi:hypothetical protein